MVASEMPAYLAPGATIGRSYVVEGLVRRSEGRIFYLATDARDEDKPRFLVSVRWDPERFDAYRAFAAMALEHPGLAGPCDVFVENETLVSVVPYRGQRMLLDEASPLPNARLLHLGQRMIGTLAYLHARGVCIGDLTRANLLLDPQRGIRLYDLEVDRVEPEPVPQPLRRAALARVGELLRRYCDVDAEELALLLAAAEGGELRDAADLGREIERRYAAFAPVRYPAIRAGMTDAGLVRASNEDNWGWVRVSDRAKLYALADGMGGHDAGEVASAVAVETVCAAVVAGAADGADADPEALLYDAVRAANERVNDRGQAARVRMGTTLVCALVVDGVGGPTVGYVANVGDSRAYLVRDGVLHQVTRDHSLVQKLVERGRLTAIEARKAPKNVLLRCVGLERDIDVDVFRVELAPGDRLLLCSDGLWGEVEDEDMASILATYSDPREASQELVRAAIRGGGHDNVTLLIAQVPDPDCALARATVD